MSKRKLITVEEAAKRIDRSMFSVYRHVKRGVLEAKNFPKTAKDPARMMIYEDTLENAEMVTVGRPQGRKTTRPTSGPVKRYADLVDRLRAMGKGRLANEVAELFHVGKEEPHGR